MPTPIRPFRLAACALVIAASLMWSGRAGAATQGSLAFDGVARPNGGIAVVGDSLTYSYFAGLDDAFRAEQWGAFALEARSTRKTITTLSTATSGLDAVRRIRALGFDPLIWIIALGTNDMIPAYNSPGLADQIIDTMMSEIGPGHRVVWVNVYSGTDPAETQAFNQELEDARARHPLLSIADWYTLAVAHPEWFVDNVHTNAAGAIARNDFVAKAALVPLCRDLPVITSPTVAGQASTVTAAGSVAVPAARRCRV